ncbi:uncharacterized protein [Euwallacea fornicatus]|uniref:uncharacterized protein n=1 Tax=Euwallacea fornicatus TaxID=995702 RepID=UPI00338DF0CD
MFEEREYTTDAIPSPPRDKENIKIKPEKNCEMPNSENEPEFSFEYGNSHKDKRQVINVMQISHSPYAHIGSVYHFNCSTSKSKKFKIIETEKMKELKNCDKPVMAVDIDVVYEQIGKRYMETFVQLDFTRSQIEQQKLRFHDNIPELIRWLLVDWTQHKGRSKATVGVLANALWNSGQKEALKIWSEQYDEIHN